jgi:hypothetical protein
MPFYCFFKTRASAGPGKQRGLCACQHHTVGLGTAQCNVFFTVGGVCLPLISCQSKLLNRFFIECEI